MNKPLRRKSKIPFEKTIQFYSTFASKTDRSGVFQNLEHLVVREAYKPEPVARKRRKYTPRGRTRIPDEVVREVRRLRAEGNSYVQIAELTGQKYNWVAGVLSGEIRGNVK